MLDNTIEIFAVFGDKVLAVQKIFNFKEIVVEEFLEEVELSCVFWFGKLNWIGKFKRIWDGRSS